MPFDAVLTAWATVGLAVFAIVTAWYARRAFREQQALSGKQLPVLEGQRGELEAAREERDREATERREANVRRVFIWQEGRIGTNVLSQAQITTGAMPGQDSVVTGFLRDANRNRWRIKPDGRYEPYDDSMLPPDAQLESS